MQDQNFESPLLENLGQKKRCGIFTNPHGEVLIIHDGVIEGVLDYIEYDPQEQGFYLIFDDGRMQQLGIKFNEKIEHNLLTASEVTLAFMENKIIQSSQKVILLIRAL